MDTAFGWIGQLVSWLVAFFPRLIHVDMRHRGVRFVRGKDPVIAKPGMRVYWPITTQLEVWPVNLQILKLRSQSLRTSDGIRVELEVLVAYRINDIVRLFTEVADPDSGIADLCLGGAMRVVTNSTMQELEDDLRKTSTKLKHAIRSDLTSVGVDVERAKFVSLVDVIALKHFGGHSHEEVIEA